MINIFLKALKTHLIDWRFWSRLFLVFLIPYFLFSYVWFLTNKAVQTELAQANPVYKVAAIGLAQNSPLFKKLSLGSHLEWVEDIKETEIDSLIIKDSLQLVIVFPQSFDSLLQQGKQTQLHLHYHQTKSGSAPDKILTKIDAFEEQLISQKVQQLKLSESMINPIAIESHDLSNPLDSFSQAINFIIIILEESLAIILTIFCWLFLLLFLSYSSLISFALAKEEKTFETLINPETTIVTVVWGKILWISLTGVLGTSLGLLGILWSLDTGQEGLIASITEHLGELLATTILFKIILWSWAIAWLATAIMSSFSLQSQNTYKAGKWIFYTQMLLCILVIIGFIFLPNLNIGTAFLPVLNTVALFKALIAGTLSTSLFLLTIAIPILLGGFIIWRLLLSVKNSN